MSPQSRKPVNDRIELPRYYGLSRRSFLKSMSLLGGAGILAGCGVKPEATATSAVVAPTTGAEAGGSLRLLSANMPYGVALRDTIPAEFKAATGIDLMTEVSAYETLQEKVFVELPAASSSYDIFNTDCIWTGALINNGWVASVEDIKQEHPDLPDIQWDNVNPASAAYCSDLEGKHYGIPANLSTPAFAYRKDLFEKWGLEPPTTWDEYFVLLEAIKQAAEKDGMTDFYPTCMLMREQDAGYSDWTFRLFGYGPIRDGMFIFDKKHEPIFNVDGRGVMALETLHRTLPYCPAGTLNFDYADANNLYNTGKAAILMTWCDMYSQTEDPALSQVAGKNGYLPLPKHVGGQQYNPTGGFMLFINKASKDPVGAYKLFNWIVAGRGYELFKESGEVGILTKVDQSDPEVLKALPFLEVWGKIENYTTIPVWYPRFTEMQRIIWEEVAAALAGDKSDQEAMQSAEDRVRAIMTEEGYYG